jgi:serine-type D-Ala-D-Ala carboxypeptidase/endopeptidase (penicillin-binding protein 4)
MHAKHFLCVLISLTFVACKTTKTIQKTFASTSLFDKAHTGYQIIDLSNGKVIAEQNASKYYLPGSCTKLLTLYTCLKVLPDTLIAYQYTVTKDSQFLVKGMADPCFLHPKFEAWHQTQWPPTRANASLDLSNWHDEAYGAGWMWDDFAFNFSCPKSAFPVHGNSLRIHSDGKEWFIEPSGLTHRFVQDSLAKKPRRDMLGPSIYLPPASAFRDTIGLPMFNPDLVTRKILNLKTVASKTTEPLQWQSQKSAPRDTALRLMMQVSDNFLAEQLLLQCSALLSDSLNTQIAIDHAQKRWFSSYSQPPQWADGSGLSHYNLMSPQFFTQLLTQLWNTHDHQNLLSLFPVGGQSGTIKTWYKGPEQRPMVYAKTGTLSHNHTLSGYLHTKSGKYLAFSFMHNQFMDPTNAYKKEMERLLTRLYFAY